MLQLQTYVCIWRLGIFINVSVQAPLASVRLMNATPLPSSLHCSEDDVTPQTTEDLPTLAQWLSRAFSARYPLNTASSEWRPYTVVFLHYLLLFRDTVSACSICLHPTVPLCSVLLGETASLLAAKLRAATDLHYDRLTVAAPMLKLNHTTSILH